jgi:voltage-gated potassium channel
MILSDPISRLRVSLLLLVVLIGSATVGYMLIEDMTFVDALYMTIITLATVGFGEVQQLSPKGRLFTIGLIVLGIGTATATISNAIGIVLGPNLWTSIKRRKMEQERKLLEKHYIVCGYGRMGRQIVNDLRIRDEGFLVIESRSSFEEHFMEENIPYVIGNATYDDVLLDARIEQANGLVAALSDDADNLMTVLSARQLNPKLYIVARIARTEAESKLRRAGADHVISPYQIGGHRMAMALIRPAVHNFLNQLFHVGDGPDMDIGQVTVHAGDGLSGQTIATCDVRSKHQVNILALQQPDGKIITSPSPNHFLEVGTTLIVIGSPENIYRLEQER